MTKTIPRFDYRMRLLLILIGIVVLFWSGLEDNNMIGVTVLGWLLAILSVMIFIMSGYGGRTLKQIDILKLSPLIGGVIGASATLYVVLLMLFKDVRHAHAFPDYPPQMMLDTLARLPFWTVGSGLILFAIALLWMVRAIEFDDKGDMNRSE